LSLIGLLLARACAFAFALLAQQSREKLCYPFSNVRREVEPPWNARHSGK
jgi:hypothetical protein